tara:strand:+ start:7736 stop:8611 length:876 start_codon:yes stop_codon:yes gene_type:complete
LGKKNKFRILKITFMHVSIKFIFNLINLLFYPLKFISRDYRYYITESTNELIYKILDKYDFFLKDKFEFKKKIYNTTIKNYIDYDKIISSLTNFKSTSVNNVEIHKRLTDTNDNFTQISFLIKSVLDQLIEEKIINKNFQIGFFNVNYNLILPKIRNDREIDVFSDAWHLDNYSPRLLNVIIYLDDVSEVGGGFQYLKDEEIVKTYKELKLSRWKRSQFINGLKISPKTIYGKKGTFCMFNAPNILHKGSAPKDKKRISLTFSLLPSISKFDFSKLNFKNLLDSHAFKIFF